MLAEYKILTILLMGLRRGGMGHIDDVQGWDFAGMIIPSTTGQATTTARTCPGPWLLEEAMGGEWPACAGRFRPIPLVSREKWRHDRQRGQGGELHDRSQDQTWPQHCHDE